MVDTFFVFGNANAHFFFGVPEFIGKFGGGFVSFTGCAVDGSLDGGPMDTVKGVGVPLLSLGDVGIERFVFAAIEQVNCKFACTRIVRLVGLDMMALNGRGEAGLGLVDFVAVVIAMTGSIVFDRGRWTVGEACEDPSVVHILIAGGSRNGMSEVLDIGEGRTK